MIFAVIKLCWSLFPLVLWQIQRVNAQITESELCPQQQENDTHIFVAVLHSLTGVMAISEVGVLYSTLNALSARNEKGGILGKQLVPIVRNGASSEAIFAREAERLVSDCGIKHIFGCWTSSSRQAVLKVLQSHNAQLYYPVQYEGEECSDNAFYGGSTPQQQIVSAMEFLTQVKRFSRFILVGSDYVFPRTANDVIQGYLSQQHNIDSEILAEYYIPLDCNTDQCGDIASHESNFSFVCHNASNHCASNFTLPIVALANAIHTTVVSETNSTGKVVILNTLNGASVNEELFSALNNLIVASKLTVMSFSLTEAELSQFEISGKQIANSTYSSFGFFEQALPGITSWKSNLLARMGWDGPLTDPMESAHNLFNLWVETVQSINTVDVERVRGRMHSVSTTNPAGYPVRIGVDHHTRNPNFIGQVIGKSFRIIHSRTLPIEPRPWSPYVAGNEGVNCDWQHQSRGSRYMEQVVKVGVLHSLSGTMSASETSVVNAELLAIEEINMRGGLLGHRILPQVFDGQSDWEVFAEGAEKFASDSRIAVTFGCWTSASRKRVIPTYEQHNALLFYPLQYEGEECSPNVFYFGATPQQQIIPALQFMVDVASERGLRHPQNGKCLFYLIGSNYVFPQTAHRISVDYLEPRGTTVVGNRFVALGDEDLQWIVDDIVNVMSQGGVIINTLNGDSNAAFFTLIAQDQRLSSWLFPIMSFSIGEPEVAVIGPKYFEGHFASWNFFQSLADDTIENHRATRYLDSQAFVNLVHARYGEHTVVGDPMESAYNAVHLWAKAVETSQTFEVSGVQQSARITTIHAPQGVVRMGSSQHLSKSVYIGETKLDGQFRIVKQITDTIDPEPFSLQYHPTHTTKRYCDHTRIPAVGERKHTSIGIIVSTTGDNKRFTEVQRQVLWGLESHVNTLNSGYDELRRWPKRSVFGVVLVRNREPKDSLESVVEELLQQGANVVFDATQLFSALQTERESGNQDLYQVYSDTVVDRINTLLATYTRDTRPPPIYWNLSPLPKVLHSCSESMFFSGPIAEYYALALTRFLATSVLGSTKDEVVIVVDDNHINQEFGREIQLHLEAAGKTVSMMFTDDGLVAFEAAIARLQTKTQKVCLLSMVDDNVQQALLELLVVTQGFITNGHSIAVPRLSHSLINHFAERDTSQHVLQGIVVLTSFGRGLDSTVSKNFDASAIAQSDEVATVIDALDTWAKIYYNGIDRFTTAFNTITAGSGLAQILPNNFLTRKVVVAVVSERGTLQPLDDVEIGGEILPLSRLVHGCDTRTDASKAYNFLNHAIVLVAHCCTTLGIVLCVVFIAIIFVFKQNTVIRYSQPKFMVLIASGTLVSLLAIPFLVIDDSDTNIRFVQVANESHEFVAQWRDKSVVSEVDQREGAWTDEHVGMNLVCNVLLWCYGIGFMITFASLFAKTWRVAKLFEKQTTLRKVIVSNQLLFGMVSVLVLCEVLMLTAITALYPFTWVRSVSLQSDSFVLQSYGHCVPNQNSALLIMLVAAHFACYFVGNYYAYKVRKVEIEHINESKYISVALFHGIQTYFFTVPLILLSHGNPNAFALLTSMAQFFTSVGTLCIIFVPKFIQVALLSSSMFKRNSSVTADGVTNHYNRRKSSVTADGVTNHYNRRKSSVTGSRLGNALHVVAKKLPTKSTAIMPVERVRSSETTNEGC